VVVRSGSKSTRATFWGGGLARFGVCQRPAGSEHKGSYDPISFDTTAAIVAAEQEIVVAVTDPTDAGTQPRGK
jgi:hypothetical protein